MIIMCGNNRGVVGLLYDARSVQLYPRASGEA